MSGLRRDEECDAVADFASRSVTKRGFVSRFSRVSVGSGEEEGLRRGVVCLANWVGGCTRGCSGRGEGDGGLEG